MTFKQLLEDLLSRLPNTPDPFAHAQGVTRYQVLRSHIHFILYQEQSRSDTRSSWAYIVKHTPKDYWEKYKGDVGLKREIEEWLKVKP